MLSKHSLKTERPLSAVEDSNHAAIGGASENKKHQGTGVTSNKTRVEQAEARAEHAEARTEQAKTRAESAETRTEQAETRTEQAKTRTEQAEIRTEQAETRTEQAETALENVVHKEVDLRPAISPRLLKNSPVNESADQKHPLEQLTSRQREILQLIAEGQNTKQIADILKVSPKTVEYHRMKLMAGLNLHDIPGLVRYAMRVGLISQES
jgi:DNA-binding CsgD family transcriptional regulator